MPPEPLGNSLAAKVFLILPAVATAIATASPSGSSEIISVVRWCGCCGCCGCGCNCRGCRRCSSACIRHFALVNVGAVSVSSCISKTCTACRCGAASWALVARQSQPNNEATQNTLSAKAHLSVSLAKMQGPIGAMAAPSVAL